DAGDDEDVDLANVLRSEGMQAVIDAVEADEMLTLPPWLRQQFLDTDAEQFALSLEALDAWRPDHAAVTCPAVLIAGSLEDPDRVNDAAAAQMSDGRAVYLDGLGHVGAFLAAGEQSAVFVPHLRSTVP